MIMDFLFVDDGASTEFPEYSCDVQIYSKENCSTARQTLDFSLEVKT